MKHQVTLTPAETTHADTQISGWTQIILLLPPFDLRESINLCSSV